jgi:hypothetical protein
MKLQPLALVVFPYLPPSAANCSRRHSRTLSAAAKKPASLAGFIFLRLNLSRLPPLFLALAAPSLPFLLLKFITQTPSSL